jgi:hypothetical protein
MITIIIFIIFPLLIKLISILTAPNKVATSIMPDKISVINEFNTVNIAVLKLGYSNLGWPIYYSRDKYVKPINLSTCDN